MQPFYPFRGDRRVAFHSPPPTFCRETSRHDTAPFAHVRPMPGPESPEAPVVPPRVPVPPCARVTAILFREATGGTSGGTPRDKDEEIRVRMGKFRFQSTPRQRAVNGVFTRTCVENRGFILAPQVGFEPTTLRLTAECSTVELLRSNDQERFPNLITIPIALNRRRGFQRAHKFPEQRQTFQMPR
jgi:hypothetical protein